MGFYLYLRLGRTPSTARWETGITEGKTPRLAELMLFDATSLVSVPREAEYGGPYPDLISDRESALVRFQRRLPQAQAALRSDLPARRSLEAFGQFMAAIDWPYVRLETGEYRLSLSTEDEEKIFNQELAFAVSALDLPAIAGPGTLMESKGQYSREWERLLNFCFFHDVCGMPFYFGNEWAHLLCGYLPRRGALNFSQIERAKRLLNLSPEQQEPWRAFEAVLRPWVVYPADWKIPEKLEPHDTAQMELSLSHHSKPLIATLNEKQKRVAHRLFSAMGLKYREVQP
jgi:hypothetical protein